MKSRLLKIAQLSFVGVAFCGLGIGAYATVSYFRTDSRFEVKSLAVSGVGGPLKRVTEGQVIGQAEFDIGTNVFKVDLSKIRERVERLRWVRHAIVQRVLPDQILIKIAEREPIGLARIRGEVYQFDVDGMILDLDPASSGSFPILDGLLRNDPEGNLAKVNAYRQVLEDLGQGELSEVHINDVQEVSVVSASDPLIINLGTSDFRSRWIKYLQLKTQIHEQYPQATRVDLRFKNQVVVQMKDDDQNPKEQVLWGVEKKSL